MPRHTIFNERPECQDRLIKFLVNLGYDYIPRGEAEKKRSSFSKVVFEDELINFLKKQTYTFKNHEYHFSGESIRKAVVGLDASLLQGLTLAGKEIYNMLTLGVSVEENIVVDSDIPIKQSFDLSFIDFENVHNNTWQVTEEFSVERPNGSYARPDVVLLVNGIPLVVIECKKSGIDVKAGVKQNIRNMMPDYIPQLFKFAQIVLALNPNKGLYGTSGGSADYFIEWKEENKDWQEEICRKCSPDGEILEQDKVATSLFDKKRFLDLIQHFILYDSNIKKIVRHQQYFAIHKAMDRINGLDGAGCDGGVIWHTQGSGKSLTMIMLVKMIQSQKGSESPRFMMVTDRVNLDKQIRENFANTSMQPARAATGKGLKALLQDKSNTIITTLVNKFETVCKNKYLAVDSDKFYIFVDEAHRSQYKAMYNYMREVLPNATIIGFTGTPLIAKKKKNTYARFGAGIHSYTMRRSIEDGITVPLVYEGRVVVQNNPSVTIDKMFDSMTADLPDKEKSILKDRFSRFTKLAEAKTRLDLIAWDISEHFLNYCIPKRQKAMIACSSRAAAIDIFNTLKGLNNPDIKPQVVITFTDKAEGDNDDQTSSAIAKINDYQNKYVKPLYGENVEKYEESICDRFKNPDNNDVNILLVKDKLLTGFDAPVASVLYVDKSMKEHNLLQAIARINRVYEGKDFGLIVDYWGVFTKLKSAIDMYDDAESGFNNFDSEDIADAIFGPLDEKNKLEAAHKELTKLFEHLPKNASANQYQETLKEEEKRKEFYEKLKTFATSLNLAHVHREIFIAVGIDKLNFYQNEYRFYSKLRESVVERYDDKLDFSQYENGIKALLDTFVHASEVNIVVKPVSIMDENAMDELMEKLDSTGAKADAIKTRIESKLKQIRYDDPLLFEDFSAKIKHTLEEYAQTRDNDSYFTAMEQMAKDFRNGFTTQDYPSSIKNDSDSKAFYGVFITTIPKKIAFELSLENEEVCAKYAIKIKESILQNTKRDWKHNEMAHKAIHRILDNELFEMFDELDIVIDKENVDIIDLLIDEIMKVAVAKF